MIICRFDRLTMDQLTARKLLHRPRVGGGPGSPRLLAKRQTSKEFNWSAHQLDSSSTVGSGSAGQRSPLPGRKGNRKNAGSAHSSAQNSPTLGRAAVSHNHKTGKLRPRSLSDEVINNDDLYEAVALLSTGSGSGLDKSDKNKNRSNSKKDPAAAPDDNGHTTIPLIDMDENQAIV